MGYIGSEWTVFKKINLVSRSSFSRNFGMYGEDFSPPANQFSCLLSASAPISQWPGFSVKTSLALDQGQLFPVSMGGFISIKKTW